MTERPTPLQASFTELLDAMAATRTLILKSGSPGGSAFGWTEHLATIRAASAHPTPSLGHHRRPGARTLGAWRNKVALPEVLLDVLVGSDPPETVLTPETIIACGLLAVRALRGAVAS